VIARDNVTAWPRMSKDEVARRLVQLLGESLDRAK